MKKTLMFVVSTLVLSMFACVCSAESTSNASFTETEFNDLNVGDTFTVHLYVELNEIADTIAFGSIQEKGIIWDGDILNCINITKGDIFDTTIFWMEPKVDNDEGWADEFVWGGPSEGSDNNGVFAILEFEMVGEGSTYLYIDDFGVARAGEALPVEVTGGVSINGGEPPEDPPEEPPDDDPPDNGGPGGEGGTPPIDPDEPDEPDDTQNDTEPDEPADNSTEEPDDNSTTNPDETDDTNETIDDSDNEESDDNSTDDEKPGWKWNQTDESEGDTDNNQLEFSPTFIIAVVLIIALVVSLFAMRFMKKKPDEEDEETDEDDEENEESEERKLY